MFCSFLCPPGTLRALNKYQLNFISCILHHNKKLVETLHFCTALYPNSIQSPTSPSQLISLTPQSFPQVALPTPASACCLPSSNSTFQLKSPFLPLKPSLPHGRADPSLREAETGARTCMPQCITLQCNVSTLYTAKTKSRVCVRLMGIARSVSTQGTSCHSRCPEQ